MPTPNNPRHLPRHATALVLLLCALPVRAFDSGSTGVDGALNPAVNVEIQLPPSGVLHYTSINIPNGVTVRFKRNAANTPVVLLVSGNASIAGLIDVSGGNGKSTGNVGDGNVADDGIPGNGGPGGFDGGRGGNADAAQRASVIQGGVGLGPGGGQGGRAADGAVSGNCRGNRYTAYEGHGLGAGHAAAGPDGYYSGVNCTGGSPAAPSYGTAGLMPLVGGSGGGGGRGSTNAVGSGGGGGGGALLIAATGSITLESTGQISAIGGNSGGPQDFFGGGGSGGAIRLVATSVSGNGYLYAYGGCRGDASGARSCYTTPVDFGSTGRIRIEADALTYSRTTDPLYSAAAPGPLTVASLPALRFLTVGGQAVPATPTGAGDVVLPANASNPVTVTLGTANVPLGTAIKVRLLPAFGAVPVEAMSSGVSGTIDNGNATVTVMLPQGPSRLEASLTVTVNANAATALKQFAANENVRAVEFTASLGGAPSVVLITVSGQRHVVPTAFLYGIPLEG